ncbi:acyltransferase family protein [Pseudomonas tritici]|uniref:acyltransferase family protein n=1 Tax=Pseudomonas tritici TaxID=2745518 RepID=UPI00387AE46B
MLCYFRLSNDQHNNWIIRKKQNHKTKISIVNFYLSRACRILPALICLCASMLIIGWLLLSPAEYSSLGEHVGSSILFISNIVFWREGGYFDSASEEKLLLHTWSLSVEWQFYVIYPIVLATLWKILPNKLFISVVILTGIALSLGISVALVKNYPSAAFYLLPSRAWEMLGGAIAFLACQKIILNKPKKIAVETLGISTIAISIIIFSPDTPWPSWQALLPVVATMLVLIAARDDSIFTTSKLTQWVGNCSYSIYLWHWPISVALIHFQIKEIPVAVGSALILTLVFGWVSYRYIESPSRRRLTSISRWASAGAIIIAALIVSIPGAVLIYTNGYPSRFKPEIVTVFNAAKDLNPRWYECAAGVFDQKPGQSEYSGCVYGNSGKLGAVIIGDSHAMSVVSALKLSFPDSDVLQWTTSACPITTGIQSTMKNYQCSQFNSWLIEKTKKLPNDIPIYIVNRYSLYLSGPNEHNKEQADRTASTSFGGSNFGTAEFAMKMRRGMIESSCELAKNHKVHMLLPIPELKLESAKIMGRSMIFGNHQRTSISTQEYFDRHQFILETLNIAAKQCGITLIDPTTILCRTGRCWGDIDGSPVYFDDDHLNVFGASLLTPLFTETIKKEKAANR